MARSSFARQPGKNSCPTKTSKMNSSAFAAKMRPYRMKVSEKGALSVYGMGRFPVTLYKEQWLKLLDMSDEIRAFIGANEAQLKAKD